jgi:hypothetical protein
MFPELPLLALFKGRTQPDAFQRISLIAVQHLLRETGCLLDASRQLGIPAESILAIGKPYSSNRQVARQIKQSGIYAQIPDAKWKAGYYGSFFRKAIRHSLAAQASPLHLKATKQTIILDDGGYCLELMQRRTSAKGRFVGIEQTTSGLKMISRNPLNFPVIAVATSCAKRFIEPPIVLRAAEAKLAMRMTGFRRLQRKGVIGLGNIGYRIAAGLEKGNTQLFVYDKDESALNKFVAEFPLSQACSNVCDLISHCDLIFGCTGTETLPRACWPKLMAGHRTLVSCSSGDVEFQALLRSGLGRPKNPTDPFSAIVYRFSDVRLTVLEGGFPITFDRAPVSAPLRDMQMTRALLFGAIIQAVVCADQRKPTSGRLEMLHPAIQKFVVNHWLRLNPSRREDYPGDVLAGLLDEAWIRKHSEGTFVHSSRLSAMFKY